MSAAAVIPLRRCAIEACPRRATETQGGAHLCGACAATLRANCAALDRAHEDWEAGRRRAAMALVTDDETPRHAAEGTCPT